MLERTHAILSLALMAPLLGCPEPSEPLCTDHVEARADPAVDFSGIHTFAVVDDASLDAALPPDLPRNTITNLRDLTNLARAELVALGLTQVDGVDVAPDVWLFDVVVVESGMATDWECAEGYEWWGWGWGWDACAWSAPVAIDYQVGTVIVGLADPTGERVIFGGVMEGVLECGDVLGRINAGLATIFSSYPQ